ncbi:MAG: type IV secretory system conjugative DNA transfer family protein [Bacilli bacterium]|nr:type IV secretory system conjugative DNA transfer family protein [Bacilli bacterium]
MKYNYRFLNYVGDTAFENRFATPDEMKAMLTRVDISDADGADVPTGGMPFISDTKTIYGDTQDYHTLILGSTGSMKSRTLILPTIYTLALAGENLIIADPKGELYDFTSGFLAKRGYTVNVLNLRDMKRSDCWNPLGEAWTLFHNGEEEAGLNLAYELINSLTDRIADSKSPSWGIAAKQLLNGLVELMIRGAQSISECNVGSLSTMLDRVKVADQSIGYYDPDLDEEITFLEFVNRLPEGCSLKNNLFSAVNMCRTATTTLAGVLDCAYGAVSAFTTSRALMAVTSHNTFDVHELARPDQKHAIFLIVPDEDTTYHFIATSFVKQIYNTMIKESFKLPGGAIPRRLNFILDEFANLPKIPDMPSMITAARSRNMRFFLVVQSNNQLRATYKEDAETIKTNCLNWVYLATKEDELIQQIQRMLGVRGNGSNEPLMSYQELSSLRKVIGKKGGAEALILMHRCRPFVSFMPDISRYEQFGRFPAIEMPVTDGQFQFFDLNKRCLSNEWNDILRIYVGIVEENNEEPEEDAEEEKPLDPFDKIAEAKDEETPPEKKSSPLMSLDELLKKLKDEDDDD